VETIYYYTINLEPGFAVTQELASDSLDPWLSMAVENLKPALALNAPSSILRVCQKNLSATQDWHNQSSPLCTTLAVRWPYFLSSPTGIVTEQFLIAIKSSRPRSRNGRLRQETEQ
jgi:hypothetical protein